MGKRKKEGPFRLLSLIVLGVASFALFLVWIFLLRPNEDLWHKQGRVNLFVNSKPALVLSFNVNEETLTVLSLPDKISLNATGGYGNYLLGKIPQLDNLEKKHGQLIVNSAREFLGIPLDGYLDLNQKVLSEKDTLSREKFLQIKDEILSLQSIFNTAKSAGKSNANLEVRDLFQAYLKFKSISGGKLVFVDLAQKFVLRTEKQPDGTDILIAEPEVLDSGLGNIFNEPGIIKDRLKSEILNSTGYPGLAERVARLVTNLGGQVINTNNFSPVVDHCRIYVAAENSNSYTIHRLVKVLGCDLVKESLPESRADFSLVLGKDYWQMLTGGRTD